MKKITIFTAICLLTYNLFGQCDPKIEPQIPENRKEDVVKAIKVSMEDKKVKHQEYIFKLKENTLYKIEIQEPEEFRNIVVYKLFEDGNLLGSNYETKTKTFHSDFSFFCKRSATYKIMVDKTEAVKYCGSFIIYEVNKEDELQITDIEVSEEKNENEVFFIVEEMPQFKAGKDVMAFREWIAENLQYPEEAAMKSIQGKVFIQFIVSKDGKVKNVKVVRGVDPLLDENAKTLIEKSPVWEVPGKQRGKNVDVIFTCPVSYVLTNDKETD